MLSLSRAVDFGWKGGGEWLVWGYRVDGYVNVLQFAWQIASLLSTVAVDTLEILACLMLDTISLLRGPVCSTVFYSASTESCRGESRRFGIELNDSPCSQKVRRFMR